MSSISTGKRVLLTGTPIQNDLGEFWAMVDFVNPGLLDSYAAFKKNFEGPIVRARQPGVGKKVVELGRGRSEALSAVTNMFVLRRTSEILAHYLPAKCTSSKTYFPNCRRICGVLCSDDVTAQSV
jgi:DNA repair and recombination protein RAD54B